MADVLDQARRTPVNPLMPRPRIVDGTVAWDLVHGYTGEVLARSSQPAGSEEWGNRP